MKKLQKILIFMLVFGFLPISFSNAITQNQINAEVQIVCTDGNDNWFSGSGTIIDPKGIILTNRHVVEGAYKNICFIGFLESINEEPNFGTKENPNLAEVKYITTTSDMDAAVLYLDNTDNKTFPYVNIWNSNSSSLKFGDKIKVIGYPGIGGSTITYTSGDFSGFGSQSDGTQNYVKTTALLEHGNSGGSAYDQGGAFVGIPSMVITGSLNSISYVLGVDSIKKWLSGFFGNDYKQEIIKQKPIIAEQPKIELQKDITPPDISGVNIDFYDCSTKFTEKDVMGIWQTPITLLGREDSTVTPEVCRKITSTNEVPVKALYAKITFSADIINDIAMFQDVWSKEKNGFQFFSDKYYGAENWNLLGGNDFFKNTLLKGGNYYFMLLGPRYLENGIFYLTFRLMDESGNVSNYKIWEYKSLVQTNTSVDVSLINKLKGKILLQTESHGEAWYVNPKDGKRYYMKDGAVAYQMMRNFGLGITDIDLAKIPQEGEKNNNPTLVEKMKGKILLQVQAHGEAWYVDPKTGYKYYMKDGGAAYSLMRFHSLGITNNDLNKIPEGSL
ncbi:MAG: S1C family serine protease [Patescibacteria group bacterium]|jgi:hypothetical protein